MKILRSLLALAAASLAQILLVMYLPPVAKRCDLFMIVVVYFALTGPQHTALLMGTGAGLTQDSLVGSVLGLNGFKKTLIGYLVSTLGSLFMLNQAIPRFGILFVATWLDPVTELGLSLVMGQSFAFPGAWDLVQRGVGNGFVGLLIFWVAGRLH